MTTLSRPSLAALRRSAAPLLLVAAAACDSSLPPTSPPEPVVTTQFGAAIPVGNGTARSYLIQTDGVPTELGVALSQAAGDGLPTAVAMGYEYLVPLPASNPTQYQVIGLNWNPMGHMPQGVYSVPHFDIHFYMTSLAQRDAIDPADPTFAAQGADLPTAAFRLAGYVNDPPALATIPHMGLHWADSSAPEFHGQPFTRTFIVGSWNGRFTFLEPMVTLAYLQAHPRDLVPLPTAADHAITGYYPGAYRVAWVAADSGWRIGLTTFVHY